jgi:hypothetical protein
VTASQARANLAHDSKAADAAAEIKPTDDVMQHVRNMSGGDAVSEGTNLIAKDATPKERRDGAAADGDGNGDGKGTSTGVTEPEPAAGA